MMNGGVLQEVLVDLIPILAIGGGILIAIIAIVIGGVKSVFTVRAREASRREIAAYIAEGTISPEQAERLMTAGETPKKGARC
jgi:hypothetical protein